MTIDAHAIDADWFRDYAVHGGAEEVDYKAATRDDMPTVIDLFREYSDSLGIDLAFQDFGRELAEMPGKYSQPEGTIILAGNEGEACGCVALRRIDGQTCEMKRLYVKPRFRKSGIGKELIRRIVAEARAKGYSFIRLDTLPSMGNAIRLYRSFGFREIAPYIFNPIEGAIFMEKNLDEHHAEVQAGK